MWILDGETYIHILIHSPFGNQTWLARNPPWMVIEWKQVEQHIYKWWIFNYHLRLEGNTFCFFLFFFSRGGQRGYNVPTIWCTHTHTYIYIYIHIYIYIYTCETMSSYNDCIINTIHSISPSMISHNITINHGRLLQEIGYFLETDWYLLVLSRSIAVKKRLCTRTMLASFIYCRFAQMSFWMQVHLPHGQLSIG